MRELERAEEFTERGGMTRRMARQVVARLAGATCKCGARATTVIDGENLCALDAQVARNRLRRAAMHLRGVPRCAAEVRHVNNEGTEHNGN